MKFIILIPLYNDWRSVSKLLKEIDLQISSWSAETSIVIVNDASTEERSGLDIKFKKIKQIKILNMKENRVHVRCIAAGLKYIFEKEDFDRVIVMDADGEDRPEELNDFFNKALENPDKAVTGNRFKRSEGLLFRISYQIHKIVTLIFTGKLIKFGNFTCLTKNHVKKLIEKSHLWNSYSSSLINTIDDRASIPVIRGVRYFGPSKMNFFTLVFHSFAIISVFRNKVIIRSIIFSIIYLLLIFNNLSIVNFIPIFFLFFFVLIIFKVSMRSNLHELNKSLENIASIDVLDNFNNR